MSWFRKKKIDVVDLGERYRRKKERTSEIQNEKKDATSASFDFLGSLAGIGSVSANGNNYSESDEDNINKKKKLAKRIMDMTNKIEELTNQIYHLQQRIEVLERKSGVGDSDYQ